jgi:DNA topoisomerase-1
MADVRGPVTWEDLGFVRDRATGAWTEVGIRAAGRGHEVTWEDLGFFQDQSGRWIESAVRAGGHHYNPSQPRDPGGEDGGQWVKGPASAVGDALKSAFEGMHAATDRERADFRVKVGKAIPPAWTDVHIADDLDTARLLARGRDGKGRPQSIYSAAHTEAQAATKFARIRELDRHLDKLDHALERDAAGNDHAAALLLIRRRGMRPGSDRDTGAEKAAHGATNLRARHAAVDGDTVQLDFTGKKGVHIQLEFDDPLIAQAISNRLASRTGDQRLFDTDERRTREYLKSTGVPDEFLLKDLRTVRANVVALREIAARGNELPKSKMEFRKWRREVAEAVSAELGNTPALALSSYINPTVFTPWVQSEDWL